MANRRVRGYIAAMTASSSDKSHAGGDKKADRQARLAAELRENLRKRKEQARARDTNDEKGPKS